MKGSELFKKINFYGSVIDDVQVDTSVQEVRVKMDFCNWKQKGYIERQPELIDGLLTFKNVVESAITPSFVWSDYGYEILEIEIQTLDNGFEKITMISIEKPGTITVMEFSCETVEWKLL